MSLSIDDTVESMSGIIKQAHTWSRGIDPLVLKKK